MRILGQINFRLNLLVAAAAALMCMASLESRAYADHVNVTGQSQKPGAGKGPSDTGNPAEGTKPSLPGDQPATQGTDPASQVHNTDPRDLEAKKPKESGKGP
jgi:hypothetical protein